jgi:hypothetical protein
VGCLRNARIPHALIGAWALAVWGRPRATLDLDFLVMVAEGDLERLGARMTAAGLRIDRTWLEWNPMLRGSRLRLHFRDVTVDLLRPRDRHDRHALSRRRRRSLQGRSYWFVSPEDFVLQKLKVGRPRDFDDAVTVVERLGSDLDRRYLRRWADRLDISGELEHVLRR